MTASPPSSSYSINTKSFSFLLSFNNDDQEYNFSINIFSGMNRSLDTFNWVNVSHVSHVSHVSFLFLVPR
jgi:hypothetical protein